MFPDLSSFYVSQNNIFPNYMLQGSFDLLKSDPKLICLEIFALKVNIYFSDGYVGSLSLSRYIFSNSDGSSGDYSHMIGQSASESSQARNVDYVS